MILLVAVIVVTAPLAVCSFAAGTVVPFLTEVVTKQVAAGWVRVAVLAFLSAVAGALATVISQGGTFPLEPAVTAVLLAWIAAVASHYGFSLAGLLPLIAAKTASVGVGPSTPTPAGAR